MPEVAFHTGVEDKIDYACRLLRKAYRAGARVAVFVPAPLLARLDQALWTFEAQDFVPHARAAPAELPSAGAARTPIWLCGGRIDWLPRDVAVNLGLPQTDLFEGFARLIEIVSTEPGDHEAGRLRWRDYKAAGYSLVHHPQ